MNKWLANRGLLQIFCALLLVIVIMFASNYIVYKNSITGIYEQETRNKSLVMQNVIQSFDSSFGTINSLMFNIHGLPYGNLGSAEDGPIDMAQVYLMQNQLSKLISSIDYVEDVIVYYEQSHLAITSKGTSNFELLMKNRYRHEQYDAGYWRTFARSRHSFKLFPAAEFDIGSGAGSFVKRNLMVAADGNKVRLSDKNILVLINVDKLLNQVNRKAMLPGASLIVLDDSRNMLLSTDRSIDLVDVLSDVIYSGGEDSQPSLTRENYEYHFYKSDFNGFTYIDRVPYKFRNIGSVTNASRSIMATAIACAVILAMLLSVYLYRPVKSILRLLGGTSTGNDFVKIYSGIVKVQTENAELRERLGELDAEARRGMLLRALNADSYSRDHEMRMQEYYAEFFRERQFVLAAIRLHRSAGRREEPALSAEELTEAVRSGLERQGIRHSVVVPMSPHEYLALVGIYGAGGRRAVVDAVDRFLGLPDDERLSDYRLWGCVSRAYDSRMSNCRAAYREIVRGTEYREVNPRRRVADMEAFRYDPDLYCPFDRIEKLTNCLTGGKTDEAVRIVRSLIDTNAERNVHHHQLVHVARTVFFHLAANLELTAAGRQKLLPYETELYAALDEAYTHAEIGELAAEAVRFMAEHLERETKSKLNPSFISQYIELHYMENLYLDHMAEVLGTSPKYFSNYFKKTFGVNYVEHLNKVRLAHAREFLKNTDLSIAEIGEKTGYLNSSTFTTTFKKYCGISPSEFRRKTGA